MDINEAIIRLQTSSANSRDIADMLHELKQLRIDNKQLTIDNDRLQLNMKCIEEQLDAMANAYDDDPIRYRTVMKDMVAHANDMIIMGCESRQDFLLQTLHAISSPNPRLSESEMRIKARDAIQYWNTFIKS